MADLAGIGSIISGIGGIGTGISGTILNNDINKKNLQFQKDVFNYQKQLQREIFQRDDTAIQRRASDILAAGGNPALAYSGSGASTGESVGVSAPQQNTDDYSLINSSLGMMQQGLAQFKQNQLTDASISKLQSDESLNDATVKVRLAEELLVMEKKATNLWERKLLQAQRENILHDIDIAKHRGSSTKETAPSVLTGFKDILSQYSESQIDGLSASDVAKLAVEAGLFVIPGFAFLKAAKLGSKVLKGALSFFRRNPTKTTQISDYLVNYEKFLLKDKNKFKSLKEFDYWKNNMMEKKFNKLINNAVKEKF